ncbi:MAG: hypothetical protein DDG60_14170 [Anaerolineae bacterium]|nr:MAG: hypothetical protein DDG60_14170 [Anaerolineae bacterium]
MKIFQTLFTLPPTEQESEPQTAQILRNLLVFFIGVSLVYALLNSLTDISNWMRYLAQTVILITSLLLGMFFLQKGYVGAVSTAITLMLWLVFTYAAYTGGGVRSSGYYGYLVAIIAAGVIVGKRIATLLVTLLCLGTGYVLLYAETSGFLPSSAVPMTSFAFWLDSIFYFTAAASMLFMTMRLNDQALERLKHELKERQQAEERAAQSARYLATLNEIGLAISEVTDLHTVLEIIRQKLAQFLVFDFYSVRVFNVEARTMTYLAVYESGRYWDEPDAPLQASNETFEVFESGKSILRLYQPNELEMFKDKFHLVGDRNRCTASVIFVPLKKHGQTIGALTVQRYDFNAYTEEHLQLVESVAIQAGIAIENARLFARLQQELAERKQAEELTRQVNFQLQQRLKELYILNAAAQASATRKSEDELLEWVVETLYHSLYPDIVGIGLWDEQEQVLRTHARAIRGLSDTFDPTQLVTRLNQGVVGKTAAERRPYRINHAGDPLYCAIDTSIQSELCVPILAGEKLLGVLNIESRQANAFSDADENLLVTLAGQIAAALERLRAEQALRTLNAELEQRVSERTAQLEMINRELEAFSYSVSHDLRTPLRSITGFANILQEDFSQDLPPSAQQFLIKICKAGEQMTQMIDALLDFARLGRKPLNLQVVDVNEIVRSVIESFSTEVQNRNIEWQISPLSSSLADSSLLRLVYTNLIGNAIKYTSTRPKAYIQIGSLEQEGNVVYFVRDNGVGFDMQYVTKLFGVFQRLHHQEEFEGTGIGLATVQRIIARHNGQIWAEAEVEKGATFYFTLNSKQEQDE